MKMYLLMLSVMAVFDNDRHHSRKHWCSPHRNRKELNERNMEKDSSATDKNNGDRSSGNYNKLECHETTVYMCA